MSIAGRLRRLERATTNDNTESCPACTGKMGIMSAGDPAPEPCEVCGREPIILRLQFDHPHRWNARAPGGSAGWSDWLARHTPQ